MAIIPLSRRFCQKVPATAINRPELFSGSGNLRPLLRLLRKGYEALPLTDGLTIELDVFDEPYEGLWLAEVEFPTEEKANAFIPPEWFGEDVTFSSAYLNSTLSRKDLSVQNRGDLS